MTTYILRADDREWQLSSRLAREIRIEAFNILFREEILQGTVWSQSVSRKNGMRALWVIDISYESFSKAVPTPTDPPIEWKKLTHAMAYDAWDDGIVIDKELFETTDLNIHVPEGAIPKDGPSAGITMITSIVSTYTGRKVRERIAMTGETTLRGRVMPIGGVKEKILAAKRAGIVEVLLPEENRKDVDEIKKEYLEGLTFHYVRTNNEVLELALEKR